MKFAITAAAAFAALSLAAGVAHADVQTIDLSGSVNEYWYNHGFYDVPAGDVTLGGTPFKIAGEAGSAQLIAVWGTGTVEIDVPVNVQNATTAFALINSFWGIQDQATFQVTFNATNGVTQTFTLAGGVDIRDFQCCDWASTTTAPTTAEVYNNGSQWLDRVTFTLNSAFLGQTIESVVFTDTGANGMQRGVVTALTFQTAAVPEPGVWALMIGGFGLTGAALRRRAVATA